MDQISRWWSSLRRDDYPSGVATVAGRPAPHEDILVYRVSPDFGFGTISLAIATLAALGDHWVVLVLDLTEAVEIGATSIALVAGVIRQLRGHGTLVLAAGGADEFFRLLAENGAPVVPRDRFSTVGDAVVHGRVVIMKAHASSPTDVDERLK